MHTLGIGFKCTRQTSYQYTENLFLLKIQIYITWTIKNIQFVTLEYYINTDSDIDIKTEGMNRCFV